MLSKLFLPGLIIALVYFLGRSHARRGLRTHPNLIVQSATAAKRHQLVHVVAVGMAVSVVFLGGWFVVADWLESNKTVEIKVINAQSGKQAVYEAFKGQVYGRAFTTVDGRRVTLADVERMEIQPKP